MAEGKSTSYTIRFKSTEDQERLSKAITRLVDAHGAKSISEVAALVADAVEGLTENAPESIMSDVQRHREHLAAALACMSSVASSYKVAEDTTAKRFDAAITGQAKELGELRDELKEANGARMSLEGALLTASEALGEAQRRADEAQRRAERAEHVLDNIKGLDSLVTRLEQRLDVPTAEHADDATEGDAEEDDEQTTIFDFDGVEG